MRNLIAFLSQYYHWLLFVLLEVVSLVLLFQFNSYQASVWLSSANTVTGKIMAWRAQVATFFSLVGVNEQLTQRNVYLEKEMQSLRKLLAQKGVDSLTQHMCQRGALTHFKLYPAKVIGNSIHREDNFITIDKGYADGIRKDMGVVGGNGVVGVVYMTSAHYSVIIPVLSTKSNISCKIAGRNYFGYLHWTGGRTDVAFVDGIPRHARFKLNDPIVTSGYSAIFPEGMSVGKIIHVYNSPDGLSFRLMVRLATDFANLQDVCVLDNSSFIEQRDLLKAATDSLKPPQN